MTREEKHNRYEELYQNAVARLLDKMDISVYDWMDEADRQEYLKLEFELGMLDECDYLSMSGKESV